MKRVLILCADPIGARMSGPAIRAFETAKVLSRRWEVTLIAPGGGEGPPGVRRRSDRIASILDAVRRSDVVITQGVDLSSTWPLFLLFPQKPAVWDLTSPVTLENLARAGAGRVGFHQRLFLMGLERGDFFICGGDRQRGLYEGAFAGIGRGAPNGLCASVPFGIPEDPPVRGREAIRGVVPGIGAGEFILLWPGGIWEWTDPLTPIRALARLSAERGDLHLVFLGLESPAPHEARPAMARRAIDLARDLGVAERTVHFLGGWRAYGERGRYLAGADAGISAHAGTVEARFAYRTRIIDCVWAGLPVICSEGDEVGAWVEEEGLGKTVPEGDVDAWVRTIRGAAECARWFREAPARMETLRPSMTWERRLVPLTRYLESPGSTTRGWAGLPRYLAGIAGLIAERVLRAPAGGGRRA